MSFFGALIDHFGLATLDTDLKVVASSKEPVEQSRADAQDENGDVAASAFYGNTAGTLYEVSNTYALKGGSIDLATILLGETATGTIRESVEVSTSNSEFPQITVSGKIGAQDVTDPSGKTSTFALPAITINGIKQAQLLGFTVSAGRLTGSSLEASIELAQQDDGVGEPIAHGLSGGTGTVTAEFVRVNSSAPAWTVTLSGATESKKPGVDEGQAAFHTTTAAYGFTLTRGTV
jgi:hypothetical protein